MNLLFVIRTYPFPPFAGDLRFNADLIRAVAALEGTEVTVFCGSGLPDSPEAIPGVRWTGARTPYGRRLDDLRALLGRLPRAGERGMGRAALAQLSGLLDTERFEAVVLSESCTAPAASMVQTHGLPILYVSHNVDIDIRPKIAAAVQHPLKRAVQMQDARKYKRMELDLVVQANAITAITAEDAACYRSLAPQTPVIELSPGYSEAPIPPRDYAQTKPLAVIIGSFEWNAKLRNLDDILAAYMAQGTPYYGLRIAGRMPSDKLAHYRTSCPSVEFIGEFDDLQSVVHDARMALVLEDLGGGFKLKMLDYVFNRLVIVAYPHAMAGSTLHPGTHYVAVNTPQEAMARMTDLMPQIEALAQTSGAALEQAKDNFNWEPRARALLSLIQG